MPLFSVVIPSFNRIGLLSETLESVFAQQFTDFEVIVVDDGSTDGTQEYLQALEKRVKIFRQPHQGPGAARNLGASNGQGKYLAFLDSDDLWFPWTLQVYRDIIREQDAPSFIAGKPHIFYDKHQLDKVKFCATRVERFLDYLASGDEWRWWGASSFVIRRDVFVTAKGFSAELINGEDADLALRLGAAPCFVQVAAPATFAYREHSAGAKKDVERTLAGAWTTIRAERAGRYPGGNLRAGERRQILTRHIRPVSISCAKLGLRREAWSLYCATLTWNVSLRKVKYLTALPLLLSLSFLRSIFLTDAKEAEYRLQKKRIGKVATPTDRDSGALQRKRK